MAGCGGGDGNGNGRVPDRPPGGSKRSVPVPWVVAEPVAGGEALRIGYDSDPCTRARRARLREDERAVVVTLLDPERDPDLACIAIVKPGCVTVALSKPLGRRSVIDGAPDRARGRHERRAPVSRRFGRCRRIPVER